MREDGSLKRVSFEKKEILSLICLKETGEILIMVSLSDLL